MSAITLTFDNVRSATPGRERKEIPDSLVTGLYLIIQPSGAKSWAVRYRLKGRYRKYTLGLYPEISLKEARRMAAKALMAVDEGQDPIEESKPQLVTATAASFSPLTRQLVVSTGETTEQ